MQQDLQTQDSSSVVAPENAAAFTAGESDGADMAAQDSRNAWSSNHPINVPSWAGILGEVSLCDQSLWPLPNA